MKESEKQPPSWRTALEYTLSQLGLSSNDDKAYRWLSQTVGITRTFAWQILQGSRQPGPEQQQRILSACVSLALAQKDRRERTPVNIAVAVLIEDQKGRLLLVKQRAQGENPQWGPPAGGMDLGETPLEAAVRETEEEIGVKPILKGIFVILPTYRDCRPGLGFVFSGEIPQSHYISPNPAEVEEARYFSPAEIAELVKNDQLYRPDYNLPAIEVWQSGQIYPLEITK